MAHGTAPLQELVHLVAAELVSEVCSVYAARPGEILELVATEGLNPQAVGRTQAARRRGHRRPVRRHRPGDEPAGRPEPPRLRLPPGDRRGAVRLHAGRAGAARRTDAGRGRGAEPQSSRLLPRRRWTSSRRWRCCWPRCWRRPAPRTARRRASPRRCRGCSPARRWSPGSPSARSCCTATAAARCGCWPTIPTPNWRGCTTPRSACSEVSTS